MAFLTTVLFAWFTALVTCNLDQFPSCVVIDQSSNACLSVFLRHWEGYPSAIGSGSLVHHEYVLHMEKVYDYDDVSPVDCEVRKRSVQNSAFENATWTRDGFTTCLEEDVAQFNDWWGDNCVGHCTEDDNCHKYPFYLVQHLWNNCSWNAQEDRPLYDIQIP